MKGINRSITFEKKSIFHINFKSNFVHQRRYIIIIIYFVFGNADILWLMNENLNIFPIGIYDMIANE